MAVIPAVLELWFEAVCIIYGLDCVLYGMVCMLYGMVWSVC